MGYRGAVYLLQEIVNRLYETLFNFLPVDTGYAKASQNGAGASKQPGNLPWEAEARVALDDALARLPFLPRISASREIQMQAEQAALEAELSQVTAEIVQQVLLKRNL